MDSLIFIDAVIFKNISDDVINRYFKSFPVISDDKETTCNTRDPGSISVVRKISWRRECLPTPVLLPGEFHGQRSLVGYHPGNHKESDTTKQLTLSIFH